MDTAHMTVTDMLYWIQECINNGSVDPERKVVVSLTHPGGPATALPVSSVSGSTDDKDLKIHVHAAGEPGTLNEK